MSSERAKSQTSMPSRWWYLLAVAILIAALAGMAAFMLPRLQAMADALTRFVVPGETMLTLAEPGTYTIFHEQRSVIGDRVYVSDNISGLRITVQSATGAEVPVRPTAMSQTYSFGAHSGESVLAFNIAEPGQYRLVAAYEDGRSQPQAVLAVGHGFVAGLMMTVFGSLAIAFGGTSIAIVVAVIVWRKRSAKSA